MKVKKSKVKYNVCIAVVLVFFAVFAARLFDWQVIGGEEYRALAAEPAASTEKSAAVRGQIFDRNGNGLVVNKTKYRLALESDDGEIINKLKKIFESAGERTSPLRGTYSDDGKYIFAEDIKRENIGKISEEIQGISGAEIEPYLVREAESPSLAPHILGALGAVTEDEYSGQEGYELTDQTGKFGIEAAYESRLRGKAGEKLVFREPDGTLRETVTKSSERGQNVWLTLDSELQKTAVESLERNVKAARAEGEVSGESGLGEDCRAGAVVMLSVKDFSVLAAATYPNYDLNKYSNYGDYYSGLLENEDLPLFDRAFDGTFACGSVFKPCVALAALENKTINKSTQFFCTKYYDYYPSNVVECMHYHGYEDVTSAMAHSCNWFFAETGRRLGISAIDSCAERLGLGVKTGIETGESSGILAGRDSSDWQAGNTVQAAIGQSDNSFTPLQLAAYTATLANNGTRMKTHIVQKVTSCDNSKIIEETEPQIVCESAFSEDNIKIVQNAMRGVAKDYDGTAYSVFGDYPVDIAAKTGTAENSGSDHTVFICYAPFEKPEVAVAVVIEHGVKGKYSMQVAKELLDSYFRKIL